MALVRFNPGIPAFVVFVKGDPSTPVTRLVKPDGYNVLETDGLIQLTQLFVDTFFGGSLVKYIHPSKLPLPE